jgi:ABC-type transporter Mla MlaB component
MPQVMPPRMAGAIDGESGCHACRLPLASSVSTLPLRPASFGYLPTVSDMSPAISFDTTSRVLAIAGEVGAEQSVALQSAIEEHSNRRTAPLVVELTEVTYRPSAAVGLLIRIGRDLAEHGRRSSSQRPPDQPPSAC